MVMHMNSFWPEGLSLKDVRSPYEVLQIAQQEWEKETGGAMTLLLQLAKSESGHAMIIVHAKYIPSDRTALLLKVIHRANDPYPVTIQPRSEQLPEFLKKSYYQIGFGDFSAVAGGVREGLQGRTVTNKWVSDTPLEFHQKLSEALNLSEVTSAILGLASEVAPENPEDSGDAPPNESPTEEPEDGEG